MQYIKLPMVLKENEKNSKRTMTGGDIRKFGSSRTLIPLKLPET